MESFQSPREAEEFVNSLPNPNMQPWSLAMDEEDGATGDGES